MCYNSIIGTKELVRMAGNNEVRLSVGETSEHKRVLAWDETQERHKKYLMECLRCGAKTQTSIKNFYKYCKTCNSHQIGKNKNTPEETMWKRYKWKAEKANQVFEILPEIFGELLHQDCFYCGKPPSQVMNLKRSKDNTLIYNGVDRKENDLGYTASNSVACCWVCNQAKSNIGYEDWINLVRQWSKRVELW